MVKNLKDGMRKQFLKKRGEMLRGEIEKKSRFIAEKIFALKEYTNGEKVFIYIDMGSEVRTRDIIEKAWQDSKKVAVPVTKKDRIMYFVEIKDFSNLRKTEFGTFEPEGEIGEALVPTDGDLFIVPGSMFDEEKNRCGYGGGFYDTYISKYDVKKPVGICFDFQLVKSIPSEEFDKKMDKIVTDKRII